MATQSSPDLGIAVEPPRRLRLPRMQEAGLVMVIVLIGTILTIGGGNIMVRGQTVNNFFRPDNLLPNVFTPVSWMAIMAVGATCVIISGGIDISVGSIFGLAALGTAAVLQNMDENASALRVLPVAVAVALGIGLACGLVNGLLVVGLRMHPFIVTLATMSIFRGIALISVTVGSIPSGDKILPKTFTDHFLMYTFDYKRANGLPVHLQPAPLIIMLICVLAGWVYLGLTVAGRENYIVGGNEEAARFSGLRVNRIKLRVYAISGLSCGIAALVSCGFYGSAATNTGETYELMVIAAAVVGGASLVGGRGTALGAMLGALIIQLIENGLFIIKKVHLGFTVLSVSKEYSKIIVGIAILLAVTVDRIGQYVQQRRMAKASRKT